MKHPSLSLRLTAILVVLCCLAGAAVHAAITVNGVEDEDIRDDMDSFDVPSEAGFTIVAELNGESIALDTVHEVTTPGYYQLSATKTEDASGAEESVVIQFIVLNSDRGTSERGLIDWVPYPTIDSAPEAINEGTLEVIAPVSIPVGMPIPMVAWLRDGAGKAVRLNGTVWMPEALDSRFRVLRGVGAGFLPGAVAAGVLETTPTLGGLTDPVAIQVESAPAWTIVDSDITTSATWAANSRIHVTGDITVEAGATLTIGAGSIVQLAPDVQVDLDGVLVVDGTRAQPVLFTPEPGSGPWGGFFARSATAQVDATGAIFTGSGADDNWFDPPGYDFHTHRDEQATFAFNECTGNFTDCYFVDLAGQALHGNDATINLTRCLVQRVISVGQFNGGNVSVRESALIEFPVNDGNFADDDNDGIYFTEGSHELIDSLIGWAKDDGVDAGSGDQGDVLVTRCWFEACYHEAMAWSGEVRDADVFDSVAINSGQGIESGWSGGSQGDPGNDPSPEVSVQNSLCIGNHVGLRFGDNYDWDYWGQLNVSDSISIHNDRDVWGMEWDSWNYRDERMDLQNNLVTQLDARHPGNTEWDPGLDGALLAPFMPTTVTTVGAGIQSWEFQKDMGLYGESLAIGLSGFTSAAVTLDYEIAGRRLFGGEVLLDSGTIAFTAGEIRRHLVPPDLGGEPYAYVRVTVLNPSGCVITTPRNLFYMASAAAAVPPDTLIAAGATSIWSYLDDGSDQGIAWREVDFVDSSWPTGGAQLGYGDGDEETEISFGADEDDVIPTYYFRHSFNVSDPGAYGSLDLRLVRDDGAIVYLNGVEVFRSNMPSGPVAFDDYADGTTSSGSENDFRETTIPAAALRVGENVVAVEVHQADASSSDVSFDFELIGNPAEPPAMFLVSGGDELALVWQGDGWEPQASNHLDTDWITLTGAASPLPLMPLHSALRSGGSIVDTTAQLRQFFRLAR